MGGRKKRARQEKKLHKRQHRPSSVASAKPEINPAVASYMDHIEANFDDIRRYNQQLTMEEFLFIAGVLVPVLLANPKVGIRLGICFIENRLVSFLVNDSHFKEIAARFGLDLVLTALRPKFFGKYYPLLAIAQHVIDQFSVSLIRLSQIGGETARRRYFHLLSTVSSIVLFSLDDFFRRDTKQSVSKNRFQNYNELLKDLQACYRLFKNETTTAQDICQHFKFPLSECRFNRFTPEIFPRAVNVSLEYFCGTGVSSVIVGMRDASTSFDPPPATMQLMSAWVKKYNLTLIEVETPMFARRDRPIYVTVNWARVKRKFPDLTIEKFKEYVVKDYRLFEFDKELPLVINVLGKLHGYSQASINEYLRVRRLLASWFKKNFPGKNADNFTLDKFQLLQRRALKGTRIFTRLQPVDCARVCPPVGSGIKNVIGDGAWLVRMPPKGNPIALEAQQHCERFSSAAKAMFDGIEVVPLSQSKLRPSI